MLGGFGFGLGLGGRATVAVMVMVMAMLAARVQLGESVGVCTVQNTNRLSWELWNCPGVTGCTLVNSRIDDVVCNMQLCPLE